MKVDENRPLVHRWPTRLATRVIMRRQRRTQARRTRIREIPRTCRSAGWQGAGPTPDAILHLTIGGISPLIPLCDEGPKKAGLSPRRVRVRFEHLGAREGAPAGG